MAVSGGGNKSEDMMLSNIVRREELKQMLDRESCMYRAWSMVCLYWMLKNAGLEVMYIAGQKGCVERLMDDLCLGEKSSVYRRVSKALDRFTVALYGIIAN